ncbi:FKBP-type peptidyl-prolyl cis-trans isomerase [Pedobacter gandavensis]|uniref:FKBP-type peptidyl-prolyl cis-trans isomerase n=1 Tax=Pedobacter gandavensis TaxID=2679963 RepID=UPI002930B981|nr:FKBP-type peptidyl-prolyl cis-trans isomerase [Pedobacter gandavensis]
MIKKLSLYTVALLATIVIFSSCKKDYETIQTLDETKLTEYFAKNNITAIPDSAKTGYFYVLNQPAGSTDPVYKLTDSVRYSIKIAGFSAGTVYAATPTTRNDGQRVGSAFGFYGKTIPAISNVLRKLQPGGTATIYLPSYLAFGKNGISAAGIPSNEILILTINSFKESQALLDDMHINAYLKANSLTAVKDPSGIYLQTITAGTGTDLINLNSLVNFSYSMKTLEGTNAQESTITVTPKSLITGFRIMLPKFTKGTKVRMFIPSVLAYGNAATTSGDIIAANSCLDYTSIEILAVTN